MIFAFKLLSSTRFWFDWASLVSELDSINSLPSSSFAPLKDDDSLDLWLEVLDCIATIESVTPADCFLPNKLDFISEELVELLDSLLWSEQHNSFFFWGVGRRASELKKLLVSLFLEPYLDDEMGLFGFGLVTSGNDRMLADDFAVVTGLTRNLLMALFSSCKFINCEV